MPFDVLKLFDAASARQKQAQGRWVRLNVERATWAALRNKVHQGDFQLEKSALQAMREARSDQALEAANQVRGAEAACEVAARCEAGAEPDGAEAGAHLGF